MPPKSKTPAPAAPALNLTPVETNLPPTARAIKDNPVLPTVRTSLETGKAFAFAVADDDQAKTVTGLLRHAAKVLDCGLSVRDVTENGKREIKFKASANKKSAKYTVAELRAWALENGFSKGDLYPRPAQHVRDAYRSAHGITTKSNAA